MKLILKNIAVWSLIGVLVMGCQSDAEKNNLTSLVLTEANVSSTPNELSATETLTPTPAGLTVPTLPPSEAESRIIRLLEDNGGCRFPCFWGFIPGQTDMMTVSTFLLETAGGTDLILKREDLFYETHITFDVNNSIPETIRSLAIDMTAYSNSEDVKQKAYNSPYYSEFFQYYTLPYLLSNYGLPDQAYVFLDTGIADMGLGIDLYILHLDYPDQGWVAHLEMPLYTEDGFFLGCPSQAFTSLRLWSPDTPARDYELSPEILFTIEEATGLTLDEFFQKFKDPATTDCLKTPSNIHK